MDKRNNTISVKDCGCTRYFTSDTHFGTKNDILEREMRPFSSMKEYEDTQIHIWNEQAGENDLIYHLGDFCNYSRAYKNYPNGLLSISRVNAKVILIIGNNEERIIEEIFEGDFERFREKCIQYGFYDVKRNDCVYIGDKKFFLNHYPKKYDDTCLNLFGHTHRTTGLYKPFGFNVGTDLNHFRLYSEEDILFLLDMKEKWWNEDVDTNIQKRQIS